jgi:chromosome segregation ATPase
VSTQLAAKIRQHRRELARAEGAEADVSARTAELDALREDNAAAGALLDADRAELRQRLGQTTAALEIAWGTLATLSLTLGATEGELAMRSEEVAELEVALQAAWAEYKTVEGHLVERELVLVEREGAIERLEADAALTDVCWAAGRASHVKDVATLGAQLLGVREALHTTGRQLTTKIRQHRKEVARAEGAEAALAAAKEALAAEERLALRSKIQAVEAELAACRQREATLQSAVDRAEARCTTIVVELRSALAALWSAGGEKQKFEESADLLIASMADGFAEQRCYMRNANIGEALRTLTRPHFLQNGGDRETHGTRAGKKEGGGAGAPGSRAGRRMRAAGVGTSC